jgi:hypothetical protein
MIYYLYQLLILFALAVFTSCASVPMHLTHIPKSRNAVIGSGSIGNQVANLNLSYISKKGSVFNTSYQYAGSQMLDLGIGQIFPKGKVLMMISYGFGSHSYSPITFGVSGAKRDFAGKVTRLSTYVNVMAHKNFFLTLRLSQFKGVTSYAINGSVYFNRRFEDDFSRVAVEPAFCFKKKHFLLTTGFAFLKPDQDGTGELFDPWHVWLGIGLIATAKWF